jgi:hypothetical protein
VLELIEGLQKVADASTEPVETPGRHHVEAPDRCYVVGRGRVPTQTPDSENGKTGGGCG